MPAPTPGPGDSVLFEDAQTIIILRANGQRESYDKTQTLENRQAIYDAALAYYNALGSVRAGIVPLKARVQPAQPNLSAAEIKTGFDQVLAGMDILAKSLQDLIRYTFQQSGGPTA